jgi:uncharacterized protein (DUF4415 family)
MKKSTKKARAADRPLTAEEFKAMRPWMHGTHEFPPEIQAAIRRGVGRPKVAQPKEKVTVRFDHEILVALRAKGKGWQTELNAFLSKALAEKRI